MSQKTTDRHFKSDGRKDPHDPNIDRCVNCHNDVMEHSNGACPQYDQEDCWDDLVCVVCDKPPAQCECQ